MTAHSRSIDYHPPVAPRIPFRRAVQTQSLDERTGDRKYFAITIAALILMYGLLQNRYWVPSGDSEVYISIARNLARGDGYTFNGQPVQMVPPGWPIVMAGVMKISTYVWPLKLLAMSCVIGFLGVAYWIIRRFVAPQQAMMIVLLTGIISHVYPATYWLISESLFCLVSTIALLLAMQVREGRDQWWRIILMSILCGAAVTVRWAGVLGFLLVAAALLDEYFQPEFNIRWVKETWARTTRRRIGVIAAGTVIAIETLEVWNCWHFMPDWARAMSLVGFALIGIALLKSHLQQNFSRQLIAVALAGVFTAGTFLSLRKVMEVSPQEAAAAKDYGGDAEDTGPSPANADTQVAGGYKIITENTDGYAQRLINWGRWFAFLFWQPFRAAAGSKMLSLLSNGVGWIIIALMVATVVFTRRLIWIAVLMYCGALAMNWPQQNARYLVPVSFLLLLGVVLAAQHLQAHAPGPLWRKFFRGALIVFVVGVALCNGALYAVEVYVARSNDFYETYEAGLSKNLIDAARYLNTLDVSDNQIAVSGRYTNLNRTRSSPFGLRATTMLTGKEIVSVPWKLCKSPQAPSELNRKALFRYLRNNNIKYYLYQSPVSPWRIWHFRAGWWEKKQTGVTADHDEAGWQLYRVDIDDEKLARVDVPPSHGWPTRVPGLAGGK